MDTGIRDNHSQPVRREKARHKFYVVCFIDGGFNSIVSTHRLRKAAVRRSQQFRRDTAQFAFLHDENTKVTCRVYAEREMPWNEGDEDMSPAGPVS